MSARLTMVSTMRLVGEVMVSTRRLVSAHCHCHKNVNSVKARDTGETRG